MRKVITILILSAALISISLCGCDTKIAEEETTDSNEHIIAAIDKSTPITKGNLITKTETDDNGNININYFDSNGNLVENFVWNENNENIAHSIMTYTTDNKIQKKEELNPDGSSSVVESYQYDSENNLSHKTVNEFEDGKLTKSTTYDSKDTMTGYSLSFFNENDYLEKIERYDNNNELQAYYTYTYNEIGQTLKYSVYTLNGELEKYTIFEYNEAGLLSAEKHFDGSDNLDSYYTFSYYDNGNIKSSSYYDADGNLKSEDFFEDTTA